MKSLSWKVGDKAHVYIGWGTIVAIVNPDWYILQFANGMRASFPVNQLSRD